MRRLVALLLALALPALTFGEGGQVQKTFARNYDVNIPLTQATNNAIVTVVNLTNTTLTLAAQPDSPRNLTVTIVDSTPSIVAGTTTITGTDVNGATLTEALDCSAGAGVYTTSGAFKTVTSVVTTSFSVLGGAGDETIKVGSGSTVAPIYCVTGEQTKVLGNFAKTTGSSSTVTSVSTAGFSRLSVGDLLIFNVNGVQSLRTVTAKATDSSITVDTAIDLSARGTTGGFPYSFQHRACDYSSSAGWVNTTGLDGLLVYVGVNTMTATGGLDYSIECRQTGNSTSPSPVLTGTLTTAIVPGAFVTTAQDYLPISENCDSVRVGLKWHTVDTAGTDSVSAYISGHVR